MPAEFVHYRVFKSHTKSWNTLFKEAAAFADEIGRQNLISISHSADAGQGVITVWYWNRGPREQG
jgi:hypothetical protein